MALTFTPVDPKYKNSAYEFDDEFVKDFMDAWNYLSEHPTKYLTVEFESAADREEWLEKARAYGGMRPQGEEVAVRRIKRTGSSDPNTGHLTFTMEPKSVADARHARLRAEAEERKRRKSANNEFMQHQHS